VSVNLWNYEVSFVDSKQRSSKNCRVEQKSAVDLTLGFEIR
jgi:hypothetical protein